jgi:hypothetical protein
VTNIITFPNSKLTVEETLTEALARAKDGKVKHVMVITVDENTNTQLAMSTIPAYWAVYMAWYADKVVQRLMTQQGMVQ